jgi:hypothetical protein
MHQGTAVAAYAVPRDRTTPNFRDGYMYLSPLGRRCFYRATERGDDLHFVYARKDGRMPSSSLAEGFTLRRSQSHLMRVAG